MDIVYFDFDIEMIPNIGSYVKLGFVQVNNDFDTREY
jgi:hypothetical protein